MKFSKYNIVVEHNNKLLIYNSKNSCYAVISKQDDIEHFRELLRTNYLEQDDAMLQALYKKKYVIDDIDEFAEAQNDIRNLKEQKDTDFDILLYVTEQCNFRCIYCPEEHKDNKFSDVKWNAFFKYIEKNVSSGCIKRLIIRFFGGEPLLESNKILAFLKKIRALNNNFPNLECVFYFVTNGYLLIPKFYDELMSLNYKYYFQITVDGFSESHNKTRPLINGGGTWQKIIDNLKYIDSQKDSTEIILRQNLNPVNHGEYIDFFNWVNDNFKSGKIMYHCMPVGARSETVDKEYIMEDNIDIVDTIKSELYKSGKEYTQKTNFLTKLSNACVCAYKGGFSISTNGKIYKCHDSYNINYDYPVGYLDDSGEIIYTIDMKEFEDYETDDCRTCNIYPICAGMACPAEKIHSKDARLDCHVKGQGIKHSLEEFLKHSFLE